MINNIKLDEQLFTKEEIVDLERAISKGSVEILPCLVQNMTPRKEYEINKIINELTPITKGFDSKVRKEMDKSFKQRGISGSESPDEEAKWEKMLSDEFAQYVETQKKIRKETIEGLEKTAPAVEAKEEVKEEVKAPVEPSKEEEIKVDEVVSEEKKEAVEATAEAVEEPKLESKPVKIDKRSKEYKNSLKNK